MRIIGYTPYVDGKLCEPRTDINIIVSNGEATRLKRELIQQFRFFKPNAHVEVYVAITENDSETYTAKNFSLKK